MNETWTGEETAIYSFSLASLEEENNTLSSDDEAKELEIIEGEVEEVAPPPFYKRPIPRRWAIVLCSCFLLVSTLVATVLMLFFTATATITITLVKKPVSFQQTFPIPSTHTFPTITKTLSQTAKATGSGHQDATYAHGFVTFFNALPSPQEVTQGQLLIGTDGIHIITDADAFIPAGTLSVNGQITVPAHVTTLGSGGNIHAGDFSGACCRDYVFARNSQFSGGQDARDFSTVSQHDVDNLVTSLSSQIDEHLSEDFTKQLLPTETMTPPICSQDVIATPIVGQEATTVTVSITKTCSEASYNRKTFTDHVNAYFSQFVAMQFGTSYIPVGDPQVRILTNSVKEHTVKISALVNGTMIYHFRKQDMDTFKRLVAGKSKEQAGRIMLKWHDMQLTGIQLQFNQDSLPSDPARITVKVKV
jgi:hypothetical protein